MGPTVDYYCLKPGAKIRSGMAGRDHFMRKEDVWAFARRNGLGRRPGAIFASFHFSAASEAAPGSAKEQR